MAVGEGGLARHRLQLQVREEVVLREQRDVGRHLGGGGGEEGEEGRRRTGAAAGRIRSVRNKGGFREGLAPALWRPLGVLRCRADLDPATLGVLHEDYFGHRVRPGSFEECYSISSAAA